MKRITQQIIIWLTSLSILGLNSVLTIPIWKISAPNSDYSPKQAILDWGNINASYSPNLSEIALYNEHPIGEIPIIQLIKEKAQERGLDVKIMLFIAKCESGYKQYDENGGVLHGRKHFPDVGIFQLNLDPKDTQWKFTGDLIGADPYTIEGNIDLAMYIAKYYGYRQWVCYNQNRPV